MKIGTIIKIISTSLAVIIVFFVLLTISNANEQKAIATQASFKQLGLDLSDASDFLTSQARSYVQYGEKKYYDAYMEEVEVTKTRERVVSELNRLEAPQNELNLVEKAAEFSHTLAELETLAFEAVERGDLETARQLMFGAEYENGKTPIVNTMQEFQNTMAARTGQAAESAKTQARISLIIFSVLFVAIVIVINLSLFSIRKKMNLVSVLAESAAKLAKGDTDIQIDTASKDEIGVLAGSFSLMVEAIQKQVKVAEHLAEGDLTVEIHPRSDKDAMGIALEKMIDSLSQMFGQINVSTFQVSAGTRQIASSSQMLAQSATEQAANIELLSSSVSSIAGKTAENANMAVRANDLGNIIKNNAEKGSQQMDQMMQAVREINEASQSINKVIKVIDDIAFQTNILALNAAVEAARAGQYGKGFAVVADEVRSLAAKSAEAAKDTGSLITNSMEKAELGVRIAGATAESLVEIVSGINQSSQIVGDIARSSEAQAVAITHINQNIEQVSQGVQENSATAEESAASSQEMSGQVELLRSMVSQIKLKENFLNQSSGADLPLHAFSGRSFFLEEADDAGFEKY